MQDKWEQQCNSVWIAFSLKQFHCSIYRDQEILLFIIYHTYYYQISQIYRKRSFWDRFPAVNPVTKNIFYWSFCYIRITFSWKQFYSSIFGDQEILLFMICHTYFIKISHIYRKHSHLGSFSSSYPRDIGHFVVILLSKDTIFLETILQLDFLSVRNCIVHNMSYIF